MRTFRAHNDDNDSVAELMMDASVSYYFRNLKDERREE